MKPGIFQKLSERQKTNNGIEAGKVLFLTAAT
jgi:hypothetical protein